jgi:hypothetical protein
MKLKLACLALALAGIAAGQKSRTPRTPWGDPDLQGIWPGGATYSIAFERDPALGTRATLSPEETAKRNAEVDAQMTGAGSGLFSEVGHAPPLSSLIVEPRNGRLPAMTEDGSRRAARWRVISDPDFPASGPEELRPYDRCISRGVLGSAFPNIYGSGMQIHQAPGVVVIRYEMVHEARIVPVDRRPHVSSRIESYMGDARGSWDGDTLVVETTNFNGTTGSLARNGDGNPTSTSLRLVERFRLQDERTLQYEVRIDDPQTWVQPWKVAFPLTRDDTYVLHEYACHEGNYAMRNILSAARAAERGGRR